MEASAGHIHSNDVFSVRRYAQPRPVSAALSASFVGASAMSACIDDAEDEFLSEQTPFVQLTVSMPSGNVFERGGAPSEVVLEITNTFPTRVCIVEAFLLAKSRSKTAKLRLMPHLRNKVLSAPTIDWTNARFIRQDFVFAEQVSLPSSIHASESLLTDKDDTCLSDDGFLLIADRSIRSSQNRLSSNSVDTIVVEAPNVLPEDCLSDSSFTKPSNLPLPLHKSLNSPDEKRYRFSDHVEGLDVRAIPPSTQAFQAFQAGNDKSRPRRHTCPDASSAPAPRQLQDSSPQEMCINLASSYSFSSWSSSSADSSSDSDEASFEAGPSMVPIVSKVVEPDNIAKTPVLGNISMNHDASNDIISSAPEFMDITTSRKPSRLSAFLSSLPRSNSSQSISSMRSSMSESDDQSSESLSKVDAELSPPNLAKSKSVGVANAANKPRRHSLGITLNRRSFSSSPSPTSATVSPKTELLPLFSPSDSIRRNSAISMSSISSEISSWSENFAWLSSGDGDKPDSIDYSIVVRIKREKRQKKRRQEGENGQDIIEVSVPVVVV
ncbi:hypothetical protein BJ741DRAFT_624510 [Chytriomyces cf. hyalinus JEL632]|nr:hypothetical protein BJ741DRAFT_624510 [Chytriomyces cf. hyalinus JEL632]